MLLDGADVVVHLAMATSPDADPAARRDLNVGGTQAMADACAAARVRHLVLVTSAAVYGASPQRPPILDEDAPLAADPEGLVGDLLEMEGIAERTRAAGMQVTVVRPAPLVGAGADNLTTRHFAEPWLLSVREVDMRWQFAHAEDVCAALALVARGGVPHEAVTVGSEGWLAQSEVERLAGKRGLTVPSSLAFGAAERLHRTGLTPAPASELAYLVHPWVVPATRLRQAGWFPTYDNAGALQELLADLSGTAFAGRRIGASDARIAGAGAAGATVAAVLGTAAFVKAARRARGR